MIVIVALIIEYVRTIIIYIIFYSFVEILLPKSNFKKYINLVMGLVMIILILNPIAEILNKDSEPLQKQLAGIETELSQKVTSSEKIQYEEIQNKMIIDNYKSQLTSQISTLITRQAAVTILSVEIDIDSDTGSAFYGQINSISLKIKNTSIKADTKHQSDTAANEPKSAEGENSKSIKKIISDFYNISADNIHVLEV